MSASSLPASSVVSVPEGLRPLHPQRSRTRSEEHTSELQSRLHLVCRLLLENNNPAPNAEGGFLIRFRRFHYHRSPYHSSLLTQSDGSIRRLCVGRSRYARIDHTAPCTTLYR